MTRTHVFRWALVVALVFVAGGSPAAQKKQAKKAQPPAPKVQILQPAAEETLHGAVDVAVKITPPRGGKMPASVYAGFGGEPWVPLNEAPSGEWRARIDSALVPNGPQTLTVVAGSPKAAASIPVKLENPLKCYFGDLHSHTSYSDGSLIPSVAHKYAREIAKLDVFSLTDHLEKVDDAEWDDLREQAFKANDDGRFVDIPGLEWTKKLGHANIFDPKTRLWPEDAPSMYQAAAEAGVIVKFNHPGTGEKVFDGLAYSEVGDRAVELMEVRRAEEEQAFLRALKLGWHLAPDGSDDTHAPDWGNVKSWTGIWAPGLSYRNIWDALKHRHVYSTLDRNCKLLFTLNGAVMGDIVEQPAEKLEIEVSVEDADAQDAIAKIELFEDGAVVGAHEPQTPACRWKMSRTPAPGKHYYFVKVTQADGNNLWSAPVWITAAGE